MTTTTTKDPPESISIKEGEWGLPETATLNPLSFKDKTVSSLSSGESVRLAVLETTSGGAGGRSQIPISAATCVTSKTENHQPKKGDDDDDVGGRQRRALVVGRQAATADLRIAHKSISRQHALLFYNSCAESEQETTTDRETAIPHRRNWCLFLQDLGGKHGTWVNQHRIPSKVPTAVHEGDVVQFGNVRDAPFVVRYTTTTTTTSTTTHPIFNNTSNNMETNNTTTTAPTTSTTQVLLETAGEGLSGRAKREAELAAMMASLDDTPTYAKPDHQSHRPVVEGDKAQKAGTKDDPQYAAMLQTAQRHGIPVAWTVHIPPCSTSAAASNQTNHHMDHHSNNNNNTLRLKATVTTCMALDPSGSRFVLGSRDHHVRSYDFAGMDLQEDHSISDNGGGGLRSDPFASVIAQDGYGVVACAYSPTGDRLLVGTASAQPVVVDRDGRQIVLELARGDAYVSDQRTTIGHVAAVTAVDWHPLDRQIIVTASLDGTARLWNVETGRLQFEKLTCSAVCMAKPATQKGGGGTRTAVTSVCFHPNGRSIALGTLCGSLQIWNVVSSNQKTSRSRPERVIQTNHSGAITSIQFSLDGSYLASRCFSESTTTTTSSSSNFTVGDPFVSIWDTSPRVILSSQPLFVCVGLPSLFEPANFCFRPTTTTSTTMYGCGTATALVPTVQASSSSSSTKTNASHTARGSINVYSWTRRRSGHPSTTSERLEPLLALDLPSSEQESARGLPVLVQWHKTWNQILVAHDTGSITVFCDPTGTQAQPKKGNKGVFLALKHSLWMDRPTGGLLSSQERRQRAAENAAQEQALSSLLQSRAPQGLAALTGDIVNPLMRPRGTKRGRAEPEPPAPEKVREPERPVSVKHKMGGSVAATWQQFVADQASSSATTKSSQPPVNENPNKSAPNQSGTK